MKNGNKSGNWNKLFASIVSNTSLTLDDVKNLSVIEFEELLDGMNEYSKEVEEQMHGGIKDKSKLEGKEGIDFLLNTFRK